jgi:hypothetical protein
MVLLVRGLGTVGFAVSASLVFSACTPSSRRPRPTDSGWDTAPSATQAQVAARPPDEHWDIDGTLRFLKPATRRGSSEHRGGDLEGEVLAVEGGPYPPRGPSSVVPTGTTIVERLFVRGGAAPLGYLVMVKASVDPTAPGGGWEYLAVTPDGRVQERDTTGKCARCHAEAPQDHLFGGPR